MGKYNLSVTSLNDSNVVFSISLNEIRYRFRMKGGRNILRSHRFIVYYDVLSTKNTVH